MFLSELKAEEKNIFLELIYKIANVDGVYDDKKIRLITKYKKELNVNFIPAGHQLEELLDSFKDDTMEKKKIILFEIYGVIVSDHVISPKEQDILDQIAAKFQISEADCKAIKGIAVELEECYAKVKAIVKA